jgi:hypothetical protein
MKVWCKNLVRPSLRHSLQSVLSLMDMDPMPHMKLLLSHDRLHIDRLFLEAAPVRGSVPLLHMAPLVQLLERFCTHAATDPRDNLYALLGMSSDLQDFPTLQVDYTKTWSALFCDVVTRFLGTIVTVHTWNNREEAVISGMGCPLGMLVLASDAAGFTFRIPRFTGIGPLELSWTFSFPLSQYDERIQDGDILCLLEGAAFPSLIRKSGDYFTVIKLALAPPPQFILKGFKTYGASRESIG